MATEFPESAYDWSSLLVTEPLQPQLSARSTLYIPIYPLYSLVLIIIYIYESYNIIQLLYLDDISSSAHVLEISIVQKLKCGA